MEELDVLKAQLEVYDGTNNDFGTISMLQSEIGILDNAGVDHNDEQYKNAIRNLERAQREREELVRKIEALEGERSNQEDETLHDDNSDEKIHEPEQMAPVEIDAVEKENIRKRIMEYEALKNTDENFQKGQDVLPVLNELKNLQQVPGIDQEVINADEILKRIEEYKRQLAELEKNVPEEMQNSKKIDDLISKIEEINRQLEEIQKEVEKNPNYDVESIKRTELEVEKYNLQKELQKELSDKKERTSSDIINEIEEINRQLEEIQKEVEKNPNYDAESIKRTELEVKKYNLQKELKEKLSKKKERTSSDVINEIEEINRQLEEIQKEVEKNPNYDAESIKRTELEVKKYNLQKELKDILEKENAPEIDNSREKERLKNIIKELEDIYNERIKIKQNPEKDIEPQESSIPEPPEPTVPEPQEQQESEESTEPKKLPRHWVEIMAETQSQSTGSIMQYFHNMGKIQPFRMGLTLWAAPIKLVMKGTGKLVGDGIGKVSSKQNEMVEKLRNLPLEEFDILVNGLSETNVRQYKVNENYMEAVLTVLRERENEKKQDAIEKDNDIRAALNQIREDKERTTNELQDPSLLPDKKIDLQIQLERQNMTEAILKAQHINEYDKQVRSDERITNLERAKTGKSTSKMNIQGWFLGKFNPDNRELHQEMAKLYKERREAEENGDLLKVNEANRSLEQLKEDNTREIKLLQNTRFASRARINRGLHTVEEAHRKPSDAAQNKGRELVATIMAGVAFADLTRHVGMKGSQQDQINQQIDQYNEQVRNVNANNQNVQNEIDAANATNAQVSDSINSAREAVTEDDLINAATSEIHRNNAFEYAVRHEREFLNDNTPGVGFNHGGSDEAIHAAQDSMTHAREVAEASGDVNTLMQHAQDTYNTARQTASDVLPDVSAFTSLQGKAIFGNSEYVTNLQNIVASSSDSLTLLKQLVEATNKIGDVSQITGTIQSVSEMSPVLLETSTATAMNILPFIASMANLANLEAQKAQLQASRNQEQRTTNRTRQQSRETANER